MTLSAKGCAVLDPLSLFKAEGDRFSELRGQGAGAVPSGTILHALPRLPADDIRSACEIYRKESAVSLDGFHCRHFSPLGDPALERFSEVISLMVFLGSLPPQISASLLALLSKPSGGYRPIGAFCSWHRIRGRLRRPFGLH